MAWRRLMLTLALTLPGSGCERESAASAKAETPSDAASLAAGAGAGDSVESPDSASASTPNPPTPAADPPIPSTVASADDSPSDPTGSPPTSSPAPSPDSSPATTLEEPLERRRARRALMVYREPALGGDFRGKIPHGEVFELFERVPGSADDDCRREGWGRIAAAAYVCLRHTETTDEAATVLPAALPDGLAPFFYARLKKSEGAPPAPRWRSRAALRRGAEPEDHLDREHDYAFVRRRRLRRGALLVAANQRVVREADIKRMKPSAFAGRDTLARPVPAGTVMSWSIEWPHAVVRAEPHPEAEPRGRLPLHAEALTVDEPREVGPKTWVPVAEPSAGWVLTSQIRRWSPMDPPPDVGEDEVWLDVDLDQQMLALRRGSAVTFLTLISSGNWKHATPLGLFRVHSKWAFADMRSRVGDDDPYYVEGVPWVQYFRGRYALHGTFWHNRFGRRTSHGCINLSAHDARWVYEHTHPTPQPGWIMTSEHAHEPGTLLRIRKGRVAPPDRRGPVRGT